MTSFFFKFSENKTKIMFFGPVVNQPSINSILGSLAKHNKAVVKNLVVLFDSEFKFETNIFSGQILLF